MHRPLCQRSRSGPRKQAEPLERDAQPIRATGLSEGGELHEDMHLLDRRAQRSIGHTEKLELKRDGALAEAADEGLHAQALAHAHRLAEVRLGVDERQSDALALEQSQQGHLPGREELLEGAVGVLEDAAEERDAGAVDLVETNSDLVDETGHGPEETR